MASYKRQAFVSGGEEAMAQQVRPPLFIDEAYENGTFIDNELEHEKLTDADNENENEEEAGIEDSDETQEANSHQLSLEDTAEIQGIKGLVQIQSVHASGNSGFHFHLKQDYINTTSGSMFSSLFMPKHLMAARSRVESRTVWQRGRTKAVHDINAYVPYPEVNDYQIKKQLRLVVERCQFLDSCFALYFSTTIAINDAENARQQLDSIRQRIIKKRGNTQTGLDNTHHEPSTVSSTDPSGQVDQVFLGDLGDHCEMVLQARPGSATPTPPYNITRSGDAEDFQYLQDALEVPYWSFMIKEFGIWRHNVHSLTGPAIVRLLQSVRLELSLATAELEISNQNSEDDIAPILDGIQARIRVLDDVSESQTRGLQDIEQDVLKCVCRKSHQHYSTSVETSISIYPQMPPSSGPGSTSNILGITFIFLFLLGAFVPGSKGFAISLAQPHGIGSTSDADFWYLLQSNIMWLLGSLLMIVFLRQNDWASPAHLSMWLFLLVGSIFAVASVGLFTFVNTGWSNLLAFFASFSAIAAVLAAAQAPEQREDATSYGDPSYKIKSD